MRSDLSENLPFDEFLNHVRRTVADGLEHQDFPFGVLAHRLQKHADPSRPPIFQVMFAHQKVQPLDVQGLAPFALGIPGARLDLGLLSAESVAFDKLCALFDLTMMTARQGDRLLVALEYSTDLFTAEWIDRLAAGFQNLLAHVVTDPRCRIDDFPLLSEAEQQRLLHDWSAPVSISHQDLAVHRRFERQAKESPEATALAFGEETLTYRELNRWSNIVARRLTGLSIGPETVIAIHLEPWPMRMAAVLGALKAGCAYLPLEPDHPRERLAAMLGGSSATVLVTDETPRNRIPAGDARVVTLDSLMNTTVGDDPVNPGLPVADANLAYVLYTSGTTGRPKGVMVTHGGLMAAADAWRQAYELDGPPRRHLQAAGFGFDVFAGEWIRALTTGGTLVACPRHVALDPPALTTLIRRQQVECLELVPALAQALADHLENQGEHLLGVRLLAVGSDTLRGPLYRRLRRLLGPGARVVNSYGLTEATIDSACFDGRHQGDAAVPIGRPLPGTRAYVLDPRGGLVPAGIDGELYIGGPGVARGYLGDARLTAARFVPDPWGGPGARMYATGDRARWRDDGVLQLLGRHDGQVKIRGVRIELEEVEAVLSRHPEVRSAAVLVREDSRGRRELAAYVVAVQDPGPEVSALRRWLKDRLPEPMIPTSIIFLPRMPLSSNGKLDRSALPPLVGTFNEEAMLVAPRTAAETILAEIVAEVAGRGRVGIHANFFELGIDSIAGIRLIARARQQGLVLEPALLFSHPTIAELAAAAYANPAGFDVSPAREIAPFELAPEGFDRAALERSVGGEIEDAYPLTGVQEAMLFHALAAPEAGQYLEQFTCEIRGDLDIERLRKSWQHVIARHPALRSTLQWTTRGRPYQIVHKRLDQDVDLHDWRGLSVDEQEARFAAYLTADRRRGFDAGQPPLSRLAVFQLEERLNRLLWSVHHVVIDGWCLTLVLDEVLNGYEAMRAGREIESPTSRPFRDYVGWLQGQNDSDADAYWRRTLAGFTQATPLGLTERAPDGSPLPPGAMSDREIRLSAHATAALQTVARERQLTLSTLIQGAWALVLSRYSGQDEVLFGVTVSGRPSELPGVESIVGMFINVLPVRVVVNEESLLIPWLRRLQMNLVELRRFETVPLSRIQTWSNVPPGQPLFESFVTVQNLPFVDSLQRHANRLGIESARWIERTNYPIAVTALPGAELSIKITFDSVRFLPHSVEGALDHLQRLLEGMASDCERRLIDLPWMTEIEQEFLIGKSNQCQADLVADDLDTGHSDEPAIEAFITDPAE